MLSTPPASTALAPSRTIACEPVGIDLPLPTGRILAVPRAVRRTTRRAGDESGTHEGDDRDDAGRGSVTRELPRLLLATFVAYLASVLPAGLTLSVLPPRTALVIAYVVVPLAICALFARFRIGGHRSSQYLYLYTMVYTIQAILLLVRSVSRELTPSFVTLGVPLLATALGIAMTLWARARHRRAMRSIREFDEGFGELDRLLAERARHDG